MIRKTNWPLSLAVAYCLAAIIWASDGDGYRPGTCSLNAYLSCDQNAQCIDSQDFQSFTCRCQENATGDGFKVEVNGTGCRLSFKPCSDNNECPEFGYCDLQTYKCACKKGFQGDGFTCTDIDECKNNLCDPHAICQNSPGSFTCACDGLKNYVGDGYTCSFICYNDNDCDVPRAKCNANSTCQCVAGYQGDGLKCSDIDECQSGLALDCDTNADCINQDPGYRCKCVNGFSGNGTTCKKRPQTCDDIPNFTPGSTYTVDPDFTGPALPFDVICDNMFGTVVTKVPPTDTFPLAAPADATPLQIHYDARPTDLAALADALVFCSQNISFSCYTGFAMFPGVSWSDARGGSHENWGSNKPQKCACGEVGICGSSCNCNGTQTASLTTDSGLLVDKYSIPIVSLTFSQNQKEKGRVNIGPLICAKSPIAMPKDCHEAKFTYNVKNNQVMVIDPDGAGGHDPVRVFCDMETYQHVGITNIPPDSGTVTPTTSNQETIGYNVELDVLEYLIKNSAFCSQSVEYTCKNSPLLSKGGYVSVTSANKRLNYFPGANGVDGYCGCGVTQSCEDPEASCNCDIQDGQERWDFGLIIDRADLPVVGLTAVVGDDKNGVFRLGNVQCSQKQFGIQPNCEKQRSAFPDSRNYTHYVDPDGPGGLPPFPVECVFQKNPVQGLTVIHHLYETSQRITENIWDVSYLQVSGLQIAALKNRSTVCTQQVKIGCKEFSIHNLGGTITWSGNGSSHYELPAFLDSCGQTGDSCNCQLGSGTTWDSGTISDIKKLPVNSLDFSSVLGQVASGGYVTLELGPLVCSETFPTCLALQQFLSSKLAVEGEAAVVNGQFTVDPDGAGGVEGFVVTCSFPTTIINTVTPVEGIKPDPKNPQTVSTCFDITYKNDNGDIISPAQITALVIKSGKCKQDLMLECKNAPAHNKVNFTACNGQPQKGWAGSFGADKCACGVNGNCAGGPQDACNCDKADDVLRSDSGSLINKTALPVCQICLSIDPIVPPGGGVGPESMLQYTLGQLRCDTDQGTETNCQNARKAAGSSVKTTQEAAVAVNSNTPMPVGCRFIPNPPIGIQVVKAATPVSPPSTGNQTDVKIIYITMSLTQVRLSFQDNEYCSQNIFLFNGTSVDLKQGGIWGFYTADFKLSTTWRELDKNSTHIQEACQTYPDLYSKYGSPRGFSLTDKGQLPVTRVLLSTPGVAVVVGDVECVDLSPSCQDILDSGRLTTGYISGKSYAIDPDGPGEIAPFVVNCEFSQTTGNGVSEVVTTGQWTSEVAFPVQVPPKPVDLLVTYKDVTPDQIHALTRVSKYCWQWAVFNCRFSPLVSRTDPPSSYYDLYGNPVSHSFGTGNDTDFHGCACAQTGTCVSNYSCNCDSLAPIAYDQGAITNKNRLPITNVHVGVQDNPRSLAKMTVTGVRCSSWPTDHPKDCADAQKIGARYGVSYSYSGEYLISPNPKQVQSFTARCEFNFVPGVAVTVIKVVSETVNISKPGQPTNVGYYAPTQDQLQALIDQSAYCYQGVKFTCRGTPLFSQGGYWLTAGSSDPRGFWGGGQPGANGAGGVCACGKDQNCGGLDSANGQRTRRCNCDYGDNTTRSDAGIIDLKQYLPISQFFAGKNSPFTEASLTVGDLYCSQDPLKFNECDLGFYDCHPLATCVDQDVGYRCVCQPGYNGKGVVVSSNQARANGRECIDDDECVASKPCPYSATCVNIPGDFKCVCKDGYRQTGKTSCEDINECLNSTLNKCDPNARCENLDGSYRCICNRGYRGDGFTCIPIGQCVCFGDPHCITFDDTWFHSQSPCRYVFAQDGCIAGQAQTFRVEIVTWRKDSGRPGLFAYVKSVFVYIFDKTIQLEQGGKIIVDGVLVRQYYDGHRFSITVVNQQVLLQTVSELLVTWDGKDVVEVTVPKNAKGNVCGLCGNYNGNSTDDEIQGPACPATTGLLTQNEELFVQSWIVDKSCDANCSPSQSPTSDDQCDYPKVIVEKECNKLFDVTNSPFKNCLKAKSAAEIEQFRYSCVYDLCHTDDDLDDAICRFAEIFAGDCSNNEKVDVSGWKSSVASCQATKCPNNLMYKECGSSSPRTCLSSGQNQDIQSTSVCSEGCFCQDDQVLEGDKCISPQQCGCFYGTSYLAVGDTLILPDCSAEIICKISNSTEILPKGCDINEECKTQDGITGCYCQEGYVKNAQDKCQPDVCYEVKCPVANMACVNGTCVCKDGYIGDCEQCQDVDECATGTSGCNKIGQTCQNTDGSFRCICEPGFIRSGNGCKDIDECEFQLDNCGDNSECVNTPGGFLCECCAGYSKDSSGNCVRDTSAGPVAAKCCACQGVKCADSGKVCGTDGKTYASFRSLSISACRASNDQLKVNYKGPCKGTCDSVVCNRQYSTCEMVNGVPTCNCPTCSDSSSSYEDKTVCATNKITYISKCHMQAATCQANIETTVEVEHTGRPCPGNGAPLYGPWSNWSACNETCKQGVQTRTREVYVNSSEATIHSVETIPCYGTCSQGPCTQDTCTGPGQVCVADDDNTPECVCPVCDDFPEQLVCGRVGNVIRTYPNECELNRTACVNHQHDYEDLEPRACEDKPVNCGLIRNYQVVVDENKCEADRSINFGQCYGGCDNEAELCCYGREKTQKSAIMYCPDGSSFTKFFDVITSCDCIPKTDINEPEMTIE